MPTGTATALEPPCLPFYLPPLQRPCRHLGKHDNIIEILDIMTGPPDTQDFHTLYIVTQLFECDLERSECARMRLSSLTRTTHVRTL